MLPLALALFLQFSLPHPGPGSRHGTSGAPASNHVVVIMLENRSLSKVQAYMPYTMGLAGSYSQLSNMYSPAHGSFNAYLENTSGTVVNGSGTNYATSTITFTSGSPASVVTHCNGDGCVDNQATSHAGIVNPANLARQFATNGKSWRVYMQSMPSGTPPSGYWTYSSGNYVRRHNPMAFYSDVTAENPYNTISQKAAGANIVSTANMLTDFSGGNIANYTWITPDLVHDGHNQGPNVPSCNGNVDCIALMNADAYMQAIIPTILASTPFQSGGDGVLIITFDEGELSGDNACSSTVKTGCGGHIFTAFIGPKVKRNYTASTNYQQKNLLATYCYLLKLSACPGDGGTNNAITEVF